LQQHFLAHRLVFWLAPLQFRASCSPHDIVGTSSSFFYLTDRAISKLTQGRIACDFRRLRLHGLIERIPNTHRYRITPNGLRTAVLYTRLYSRMLGPGLAIISIRAAEAAFDKWYDHAKIAA
jgi:hypothetical protein